MAAIVEAVADHKDVGADTLPPLEEAIDPAILQTVLEEDGDHHLRFEYRGYAVRVDGDGSIVPTDRRQDG